MAERRDALKIIGSISATCAFPFAADELYAQHEGTHGAVSGQAALPEPAYFNKADFATIAAIAERIIPQTDTPGAGAAGVPAYGGVGVAEQADQGAAVCRVGGEGAVGDFRAAVRALRRGAGEGYRGAFFQGGEGVDSRWLLDVEGGYGGYVRV